MGETGQFFDNNRTLFQDFVQKIVEHKCRNYFDVLFSLSISDTFKKSWIKFFHEHIFVIVLACHYKNYSISYIFYY
jgi:hypothetical protein